MGEVWAMVYLGQGAAARGIFRGILASAIAIFLAPSTGWASAINIDSALTIFAPGVLGTSGQPWIITQGTSSIVQTTGAQFTSPPGPGAGTSVAASTGGGTIIQDITSLDWQGSTNYTLDFFIGVPLGQAAPPTLTVSLLYASGGGAFTDGLSGISGTLNGASFSGQNVFGLSAAAAGTWKEYTLNFTTPSLVGQDSLGKPVTVDFRADGSSNTLIDWYLPVAVPGPVAGSGLPGLALVIAFLAWSRRRSVLSI
jgi:hypothetical protein